MAHAVPGPGIPPDAGHDWFADFAEEEPALETPRDGTPVRAFDDFTSERQLIDRAAAIDDWSLASKPAAAWEPVSLGRAPSFTLPSPSRTLRVVALGAAVVALAAWWIAPRLIAGVPLPALPPPPALPLQAEIPAVPAIYAAVSPVAEAAIAAPAARPADPVTPSRPEPAPAAGAPALARLSAEALAARAAESPAIDAVVSRYRAALGALDVNQVALVWPAADRAALERTFDALAFQSLEFDGCAIDVRNLDAQASCRGRARVVVKATSKTVLEPRRWDFTLRKDDRGWVIRSVAAGR